MPRAAHGTHDAALAQDAEIVPDDHASNLPEAGPGRARPWWLCAGQPL
jgi:hypothetical protein